MPGAPDKSAYDELPDGVVVADDSGSVIVVNPAAEKLLGASTDELIGRDYRDALPLSDGRGRDWWQCTRPYDGLVIRRGQPERQLTLNRAAPREVLVTVNYVREHGRVVRLVVSLRDAAARERLERDRAELVSTVAHELRSPLTSVKGFTATLLAKWDRFNDEQKHVMLQTVNEDADRVTRLIAELLDVSRIDAGRLELRRQLVDVVELIKQVVAGTVAAGEPADRFVQRVEGNPMEIWADPDKLRQVVGNLVENAVRHGAGTVTVTVSELPDGVGVTVDDEGSGVAPEVAPRIFTKFWRGGNRRGSTGLGLYIAKGLVTAHGGSIEVGAATSGGARFRFTLPVGTPPYS